MNGGGNDDDDDSSNGSSGQNEPERKSSQGVIHISNIDDRFCRHPARRKTSETRLAHTHTHKSARSHTLLKRKNSVKENIWPAQ